MAGLFETLLGPEDAIISDELNHASIIDGVRLCKAQRFRYKNNDMADLEAEAAGSQGRSLPHDRHRRRVLDGWLHRESTRRSVTWPNEYDALVMVDDSHAVGFMGDRGRGTHEYHGVMDRVDIITGHARQSTRRCQRRLHERSPRKSSTCCGSDRVPTCFSNSVAPPIVAASIKAIELLIASTSTTRQAGRQHAVLSRADCQGGLRRAAGRTSDRTDHAVRCRTGQPHGRRAVCEKASTSSASLYPVVPKGKARIRTQISAAHSREDLAFALEKFAEVRKEVQ